MVYFMPPLIALNRAALFWLVMLICRFGLAWPDTYFFAVSLSGANLAYFLSSCGAIVGAATPQGTAHFIGRDGMQ